MQINIYDSKVAKLHIATHNNSLVAISFSVLDEEYLRHLLTQPLLHISGKSLDSLNMELDHYFQGSNPDFSFDIALHGTEFQKKVWLACATIPYGETRSYSDIARMIGNQKATRAVGSALGKNPVPLIIPCHRVLRSNGNLGGFAGGLDVKRKLLEIEKSAEHWALGDEHWALGDEH
jgi:methylated-DNA-[protein]-cysteine S-methyltransferase